MSNFIKVKIRERAEGNPGFMDADEFEVTINLDNVTLFNGGEDQGKEVTFVRLACGAMLCLPMSVKEFENVIVSIG